MQPGVRGGARGGEREAEAASRTVRTQRGVHDRHAHPAYPADGGELSALSSNSRNFAFELCLQPFYLHSPSPSPLLCSHISVLLRVRNIIIDPMSYLPIGRLAIGTLHTDKKYNMSSIACCICSQMIFLRHSRLRIEV